MTHDLNEILRWYWEGRFTAEDVTRATGLTERAQRELLKVGVIQPIPQAKTKARLLNARMLKRVAIIAPLNACGFSLAVAGQIVYAAPFVDDHLFELIDPIGDFEGANPYDPATKFPLEMRDFAPEKPPVAELEWDWSIEVLNGRYVAVQAKDGPDVFGELSPDKTAFYWWSHCTTGVSGISPDTDKVHSKHEYDRSMSDEMMTFSFIDVSSDNEKRAQFAAKNPVTKISVNVSLALKKALRKLIHIDQPEE